MFLKLNNTDIGYTSALIKGAAASLDLGEICLLMGNNGVGKTTLIKSILNQNPVLDGEIMLEGSNVKTLSAQQIAEKIAVVFSKAHIPDHFTVTDLVSLGKYIHYPYYFELNNADRREVDAIIEQLNLQQYRNLPLHKLSDGNLQKTFIGRALAQNSPFIILDEPTTHLDEENKIAILKLLRNLAKDMNRAVLFSSHDWRLAKEFADKIWLVKDSRLINGMVEDVMAQLPDWLQTMPAMSENPLVVPSISAPPFQRELLISALKKNWNPQFTWYRFEYSDSFWLITAPNFQKTANSFEELISVLQYPN